MQRRPDLLTNYEKWNKISILELQLQMARRKKNHLTRYTFCNKVQILTLGCLRF